MNDSESLSLPEVRHALATMRAAWFKNFSPLDPFCVCAEISTGNAEDRLNGMSFSRFALEFELANHMKRHTKSTATGDGTPPPQ